MKLNYFRDKRNLVVCTENGALVGKVNFPENVDRYDGVLKKGLKTALAQRHWEGPTEIDLHRKGILNKSERFVYTPQRGRSKSTLEAIQQN